MKDAIAPRAEVIKNKDSGHSMLGEAKPALSHLSSVTK